MNIDKYSKMLFKLYLKGIIDEETLEEKLEEAKRKNYALEEEVNKALLEAMNDGYVKKAMERISAEKFNKE